MDDDLPLILRSATYGASSRASVDLRRREKRDELHRVAEGCFVLSSEWASLRPRERHVLQIRALAPRIGAGRVLSHVSAAALFGWADLDTLPAPVHLIDPSAQRSRRRTNALIHAGRLTSAEIVTVDGLAVTSPMRTAFDLAHDMPFAGAVAAIDSALHFEVLDKEALSRAFAEFPVRPRRDQAAAALRFSDKDAEAASESLGRIVLHELGAPRPVLQKKLYDNARFLGRVDFFFAEQGVALETDGYGKYTEARYLKGRDPADVFVDEKRREQDLHLSPELRTVVRCEWRDLRAPRRLRRLLLGVGVPVP
ncbi:hypothetical protein AX769_20555 [Frondihabitans sp. PAMC 28766]|uniref:hypothetical protein n=1 Tax=Frondihabitans sp. PAMC 28766 TaxID=1795630 RepID=UPI00078D5601|nr:hypothetical protein [Frondihabitans sp. PAMC 28766]AMM22099.1 hypothetical protein AX769_20555 [Frondihabitans sp. PAMC 28766]